jgi:Amidase
VADAAVMNGEKLSLAWCAIRCERLDRHRSGSDATWIADLLGRIPEVDATTVARMKDAGAIVLAKTNPPEFSYATETTIF